MNKKTLPNHNINFNVADCHSNTLFCNKLWQATKFGCLWYEKLGEIAQSPTQSQYIVDQWVLGQLSNTVDRVNASTDRYDFHIAVYSLRRFLYRDICDVYLELIKPSLRAMDSQGKTSLRVLLHCLDLGFRCLHPFMPFVSELLYDQLPVREFDSICNSDVPHNLQLENKSAQSQIESALDVVEVIRKLKCEHGASQFYLKHRNLEISIIETLAKIHLTTGDQEPSGSFIKETVDLETTVYCVPTKEIKVVNYEKRVEKIESELEKLKSRIESKSYLKKVPSHVLAKDQVKVIKLEEELQKLKKLSN